MSEQQGVDAVTPAFVATARPEVVQVEIDGEIVLYDDRAKVMHRLNPIAGQVWRCLDGSGSLDEVAADLADVYQADPGQVLTDVLAAARQFGSAGLLVGVGDPPDPDDAVTPLEPNEQDDPNTPFFPEILASCMDRSFPLGDAGSLTVKAGPYLLGVRFSTPELVDTAKQVLAGSLVKGVVAPPNVSVKVATAQAGQPLLYCYRSSLLVARVRSPKSALAAAARLLSSYVPPEPGNIRLPAMTAVRSGVVALLCSESWLAMAGLMPRLRVAGWQVLDAPETELDPEGHVVIPPLEVAVDGAALADLPANRFDHMQPAPGRYPVAAWVAVAGDDPMPETMAGRVALAAAAMSDLDAGSAPSVFETTTAMLRGAAWAVSPTLSPNDLAATLARAVPEVRS